MKYKEKFPNAFPNFFFTKFLADSYIHYHDFLLFNPENLPLIQIFDFVSKNPRSPHCKILLGTLTSPATFFWLPKWSESGIEQKTPFVFSCHECIILQKIIQHYPKSPTIITAITIPDSYENNYTPVLITISTHFFIPKSTDNFETLFLEQSSKKISTNENAETNLQKIWTHFVEHANNASLSPLEYLDSPSSPKVSEEFRNYALVQIKPNELCVSCEFDKYQFLSFYNLDTKEPFAFVKEIPLTIFGYKLNSNIVLFYKNDCIFVIDSIKHENLSKFQLDLDKYNNKNYIFSLGVLTSNMILIGDLEGNIIQCSLENEELTEISRKKDAHVGKKDSSNEVSSFCILGDGHIATGGYDDRIKIW